MAKVVKYLRKIKIFMLSVRYVVPYIILYYYSYYYCKYNINKLDTYKRIIQLI
jgi:hypothetical protein